jgi:hypothetical protein
MECCVKWKPVKNGWNMWNSWKKFGETQGLQKKNFES